MNRTDLRLSKDRDAMAQPLRIHVTDSAKELLALQELVRQAIPMLEKPEDCCTGRRLRLARELKAALRCQDDPAGRELPLLPDADTPVDEQYTTDYWLQEEQG